MNKAEDFWKFSDALQKGRDLLYSDNEFFAFHNIGKVITS
jgi:hypothetical protein